MPNKENTPSEHDSNVATPAEKSNLYSHMGPIANNVVAQYVGELASSLYPSLERATSGSCAIDLRAVLERPLTLHPGQTELIPTGIKVDMTPFPCLGAVILPRSGLGHKHGIVLGNLVGLVDNDYQGEIKVSLWNRGTTTYGVEPGERIAQLAFLPFVLVNLLITDSFESLTERGEDGFGHSGRV